MGGTPSSRVNRVIFAKTVLMSAVWFAKLVFISVLVSNWNSSYNVTKQLACVVLTVWIVLGLS